MIYSWTPHIKTERLILREANEKIFHQVFKDLSIQEQLSFFGLEKEEKLINRRKEIEKGLSTHIIDYKMWHLLLPENNECIGECGFHTWKPYHQVAEIGYHLRKDIHKNKGYMSEAMEEIIKFGFQEMNINRIEAFISPDNVPSLKLVKKFGFSYEGLHRENYRNKTGLVDSVVHSLLKREYFLSE